MERKLQLQSEIHVLEDQQVGFCCVKCGKYGMGCGGFICGKMENQSDIIGNIFEHQHLFKPEVK
jgi:hypothetical protein